MSQEQEDLIIAMIAQAEESQALASKLLDQAQALQNQADRTQKAAQEILISVPAEIRRGASAGSREILLESTKVAVVGLKSSTDVVVDKLTATAASLQEAAAEGRASAKAIRRTGLLLGVFLLSTAVIIIGLTQSVFAPALVRSYADDLAGVKAELATERAALAKLRSETWRLELVEYQDGTRGILLPKGVKVDRTGPLKDGRVGIVITP